MGLMLISLSYPSPYRHSFLLLEFARDPSKVDLWEKAVCVQAMLATKLRLTAQSRVDPKKLERHEQTIGPAGRPSLSAL